MEIKEKIDVRDEVFNWLTGNERNLGWLSTKTGYKYATLYSIFKLKTVLLSDSKLDKINQSLGTKFKR